jgi:hypothetical protein
MRRNPLLISAGVLVVTVSAVIAVRYLHTYESSAQAGAPPAAVGSGNTTDGDHPDADPTQPATAAKGMSVIVRDRKSGGEWRSGETTHPSWTSSTIKLAMAVNLLERNRTGEIKLDTAARKLIAAMLDTSSDAAADALWDKYGGEGFVVWFQQQYGMAGLTFPAGAQHRWSHLKGTTEDLVRLMTYVLDRADPADRDYLVAAMRRPGAVQQWGVWAAGGAQQPGVTNGWSLEADGGTRHWVTHSVGFAGPDGQYAIAVMYDLPAGAKIDTGVQSVSNVIATLFGAPTPAPVKVPPAAPAARK